MQFEYFDSEGYFQEYLDFECLGDNGGFIAGLLQNDQKTEIQVTLKKSNLLPVYSTIASWSEDDFVDMIEFLYAHISKPTERYRHEWNDCGWHCHKFDREEGWQELREKLNRLLQAYDSGFEFTPEGQVLALAPTGLESLVEAPLHHLDEVNVTATVAAAIEKFRRHRSSIDTRRDAVRGLAAVPDYDKDIWLDWMFYYYLATIHTTLRRIEGRVMRPNNPMKGPQEAYLPFVVPGREAASLVAKSRLRGRP